MEITRLIDELRRPDAYPFEVSDVEVRQTHISVVFLVGAFAYKVKKPVDLGFLDFTTPDRRLHFCEEEVRLNRRLAPDVYLGVVPIVRTDDGLRLEAEGEAVEHAVKMRRLPDRATLLEALGRGELDAGILSELGERIAAFHAGAASGPEIARYGRWDIVAANARENLEQSRSQVGSCISEGVHRRHSERLEACLEGLRDLIEARARHGLPRDTHGDLHLDHVYLFPDRAPPGDLVAIDCIEFNQRFRYADPVADMAFLAMDLAHHGRRDLQSAFAEAYLRAADDAEGERLLAFYIAYRAAVRGKVEGMAASEQELPHEERQQALRRSQAHWLLAHSELEEPDTRPCLVLVGGLPGTGKSTVAVGLAARAGFRVISSDRVRKELAGLTTDRSAAADFGQGIYTPEWNDRTYAACLERAEDLLFEGERVVVDASFRAASRRRVFLDAAQRWGVRSLFLLCEADPATVRRRLDARDGGASDADWSIYQKAAEAWEPVETAPTGSPGRPEQPGPPAETGPPTRSVRRIQTGGTPPESVEAALSHLRSEGLAS